LSKSGPGLLRAPAAYIPVAPVYNWSGFYVGGNLGAAWNSGGSVSDTFGSTFTGSGQTTKFTGGGQVGVNYEFWGGVVIGAEATFNWLTNTTNTVSVTNSAIPGFSRHKYRLGDAQQSMANDRDGQTRLRMGSGAALR
jgi:outer membrane immunogenic protein